MTCDHAIVTPRETMNPRLPFISWNCDSCGREFRPVRHRLRERRELRRLKRDLEEWRNG